MSGILTLGNRLYRGEVSYNIVGKSRTWYTVSAVFLTVAILTLIFRGLNLGIEFKGGAEFTVPVKNATTQSISDARSAVKSTGVTPANVTIVGGDKIRIQTATVTTGVSNKIGSSLAGAFSVNDSDIKVQLVGPSWGSEVSKNAARALLVFLVLVALFLATYFEWSMAVAALVALAHDVLITVGIYALSGFEVTPAAVIGFLTILGYSLYDTVVVFDKVKENTKGIAGGSRLTFSEAANLALNQTLVRSINTSVVALLPVLSILVVGVVLLGAGTLNDLALALFVGMLVGAYSSIFIATPFLSFLKERTPEMQSLRKRVNSRRKGSGVQELDSASLVVQPLAQPVVQAGPRQQRVKKPRSNR